MTIQRLPDDLINQIAAGEVIERPASIIKETIENALDAHATQVIIRLKNSGIDEIIIEDNGAGIPRDDLLLAFERHATSKIHHIDDLNQLNTFGFRGEALAAMAGVARCRLTSKSEGSEHAWMIETKGAKVSEPSPAAFPQGTQLVIQDLFYTVPVRKKFLKSPKTELSKIEILIKQMAMGYPQVTFQLIQDNKKLLYYPAVKDEVGVKHRLKMIWGKSFFEDAKFIQKQSGQLSLSGWLGYATSAVRHTNKQAFFVNGRLIKDKFIQHAIHGVYSSFLSEGQYPVYMIQMTLNPGEVDINVHPTKQEARFVEAYYVYQGIKKAIFECLSQWAETEVEKSDSNDISVTSERLTDIQNIQKDSHKYQSVSLPTNNNKQKCQYVGQIGGYALFQSYQNEDNAFWVLDKKEALMLLWKGEKGVLRKKLMFPMSLTASIHESRRDRLHQLGFVIHDIAPGKSALYEYPIGLEQSKLDELITALNQDKDITLRNFCPYLSDKHLDAYFQNHDWITQQWSSWVTHDCLKVLSEHHIATLF